MKKNNIAGDKNGIVFGAVNHVANAPTTQSIEAFLQGLSPKQWYVVNLASDIDEAEVMIYDVIGAWGISADTLVREIKAIKARRINVRLNTPGGSVFDGTAIYNALREHPAKIVTHIDGVAASAGSFIALAGDEVRMADNAYLMIHDAWGMVMGTADDMRKQADLIDKMSGNIAKMYQSKAGESEDYWLAKMDEETWYTADEAKAAGLIDTISEAPKKVTSPAAEFSYGIFNRIPEPVQKLWGVTNQINTSPEALPRGTPGAVPTTKETPMNLESFKAYAAEHPDDPAVKAIREEGKKSGHVEAREELRSIVAACPGRPDLAISQHLAGADPEQAKAMADELDKEASKYKAEIAAKDKELADARAHQRPLTFGGSTSNQETPAGKPDPTDHKAVAEWEWENEKDRRAGFSTKDNYVNFRSRELSGAMKVFGLKSA